MSVRTHHYLHLVIYFMRDNPFVFGSVDLAVPYHLTNIDATTEYRLDAGGTKGFAALSEIPLCVRTARGF